MEKDVPDGQAELSFTKEQLGTRLTETKMLGLPWNKTNDTLKLVFPHEKLEPTKRGVLSCLAKVYDPLGLALPVTLIGKLIFQDINKEKLSWDMELPDPLRARWENWFQSLPESITIPRAVVLHQQPVKNIELHTFGDASSQGVSTAVYGVTQSIVAAKSRLAKHGLTIPRLELVAAHMATNLIANVQRALVQFVAVELHCWLDSTVALYWIKGKGE